MTSTDKPTVRRTSSEHSKHKRRLVATLVGDCIELRLEREQRTLYVNLFALYDRTELSAAASSTGADITPCANPKKVRNV